MSNLPAALNEKLNTISAEITSCAKDIETAFFTARERALVIGRLLTEARALLPHGEFQKWAEKNTPFTVRTASNYLNAWRNYQDYLAANKPKTDVIENDSKSESFSDLADFSNNRDIQDLYASAVTKTLAPPKPKIEAKSSEEKGYKMVAPPKTAKEIAERQALLTSSYDLKRYRAWDTKELGDIRYGVVEAGGKIINNQSFLHYAHTPPAELRQAFLTMIEEHRLAVERYLIELETWEQSSRARPAKKPPRKKNPLTMIEDDE
jgi:hypothetical protein